MTSKEIAERYNTFILAGDLNTQIVYKKDGRLFYKDEWHVDYSLNPRTSHVNNTHRETNINELIQWLDRVKNNSRLSLLQ